MILRRDNVVLATRPLEGPIPVEALTAAEWQLVEASGSPARRQERAVGRWCVREARQAFDGVGDDDLLAAESGRPIFARASHFHASIAHDGGWVLGAVADRPIGVDLVACDRVAAVRPVVDRWRRRSAEDASPWPGIGPALEPLLRFSAWEALGKRVGTGITAGMVLPIETPRREAEGWAARSGDVQLTWWHLGECLACLAQGA